MISLKLNYAKNGIPDTDFVLHYHYQKIILVMTETDRLMSEINKTEIEL